MKYNFDNFESYLAENNLSFTEKQMEQFETFYELLVEKNEVMNLTTITEWDEVVEKHFEDSLSIVQLLDVRERMTDSESGCSLMDIGSGAGFPGIPLAIAFPELKVTLMDSLSKRVFFLRDVIAKLGLKNVSVVHERAEILAKDIEYREKYDLVVSRAVANLSTLSEYCLPFAKVGGLFVSYKSMECDKEVEMARTAVWILGGKVREIRKFMLGEAGRAFVVVEKKKACPRRYPRKAGTPEREPLIER